jgi:pimeloyl-ACP methyl ester carboxylesterase
VEVSEISIDVEQIGKGETLVYFGSALYRDAEQEFVDTLAQNFSVYAPRYPGFDGCSPPKDFRDIADLAYLYLEYIARAGIDRPYVVASSFGAWIALEMSVRNPALFAGMTLIAPLGVKSGTRTDRRFADFNALSIEALNAALFCSPSAQPNFADWTDAQMESLGLERQYLAYYAWSPYLHNPGLTRWLPRISTPTQLIWGAADKFNDIANGELLATRLGNAQLQVIANVGHFPHLEAAAQTEELIATFAHGLQEAKV